MKLLTDGEQPTVERRGYVKSFSGPDIPFFFVTGVGVAGAKKDELVLYPEDVQEAILEVLMDKYDYMFELKMPKGDEHFDANTGDDACGAEQLGTQVG